MKDYNLDKFKKNNKQNDDHYCIAKGDTGASSHYFMAKNRNMNINIKNLGPQEHSREQKIKMIS